MLNAHFCPPLLLLSRRFVLWYWFSWYCCSSSCNSCWDQMCACHSQSVGLLQYGNFRRYGWRHCNVLALTFVRNRNALISGIGFWHAFFWKWKLACIQHSVIVADGFALTQFHQTKSNLKVWSWDCGFPEMQSVVCCTNLQSPWFVLGGR